MKIPSFIFLLIGATIAYMSHRIGEKMVLFFWVGLFFIAYGSFQMIIAWVLKEKRPPTKRQAQAAKRHQTVQTPTNRRIIHCPRCRAAAYATARFCYACGTRLR